MRSLEQLIRDMDRDGDGQMINLGGEPLTPGAMREFFDDLQRKANEPPKPYPSVILPSWAMPLMKTPYTFRPKKRLTRETP